MSVFLDKQVNYFRDKFCNAERIINNYDYNFRSEYEYNEEKRVKKVEKEVRDLDNLECVYCSKELDTTAKRKYFPESDEFITERVFLCCYSCLKERKNKELEPKFGRFLIR